VLELFIPTGIFSEQPGVFVTLHIGERLRGCVGVVSPSTPGGQLWYGAKLERPWRSRFPAMRSHEVEAVHIEISLLSTQRTIRPEKSKSGSQAAYCARKPSRSVLPQGAVTHH